MGGTASSHNPVQKQGTLHIKPAGSGRGGAPPPDLTSRRPKRTLLQLTAPMWTSPLPLSSFSDCLPCSLLTLPSGFLPALAHARPGPASEPWCSLSSFGMLPQTLGLTLLPSVLSPKLPYECRASWGLHTFTLSYTPSFYIPSLALNCLHSIYPYLTY